jgi:uncharacterized protein YcbK (DUF882 family)
MPPTVPAHERGQALPLLAIVLVLAAAAAAAVGAVGVAATEDARAQTAADAAALAGAAGGPAAAQSVAAANGAEVVGYRDLGATVEVEVRYRRATAIATAEAAGLPAATGAGPGGDRAGLAPAIVAALARADALLGHSVPVVSGYRTAAEQESLWNRRTTNPYPVARPGTSLHEAGLAIDVPASFVAELLTVAGDAGLCQPLPNSDPVHFEPCPPNPP